MGRLTDPVQQTMFDERMATTLILTFCVGLVSVASPVAAQQDWRCTEPAVSEWPVVGTVTERFPAPMPTVVATRTRSEAAGALREGDAARSLALYRRAALEDPDDLRGSCGAALAAVRASRPGVALRHAWLTERAFSGSSYPPLSCRECGG